MALDKQDLIDELDKQFAALDEDMPEEIREAIKDGLATAVATAVYNWLTGSDGLPGAEVSFSAGDFSGTDSGGDTPSSIAASGGTIS